jgi:seryl-tRNA synthetase
MPKLKDLINREQDYIENLKNKNAESLVAEFKEGLQIYNNWKKTVTELNDMQAQMNTLSKEYGKNREDTQLFEKLNGIKEGIKNIKKTERDLAEKISELEIKLPNYTHQDVPIGNEGDEIVISYTGIPKVSLDFKDTFEKDNNTEYKLVNYKPYHHYDLVGKYIDQEIAGKLAMSRFYYEFDDIVMLDFALTMYTIEFFRNKKYINKLMIPPYVLKSEVEEKITYFQAFQDTIFKIEKDNLLLIPSSEHSIAAYYTDTNFKPEDLPYRILAWSPCFRKEAGAHGKDTRGIFRVKQFQKLELHSIVKNGEGLEEINKLSDDIQEFMLNLNLPTRRIIVASGDMDKRALKQIDIETWMPGQGKYRETHSIATLGNWLSEKLRIRCKSKKTKELAENVYATAIAIQRTMCAIVENNYDPDTNSVKVPEVLHKYIMGIEEIKL